MAKSELGEPTPPEVARMVRLQAATFTRPVGGGWTLTDIAIEQRGFRYEAERDEARTRIEVWHVDKPERRVVVPMGNVAWYVDAEQVVPAAKGK